MFVVILISLNLLYPYTFTGVWYRTFLLLGAIASFYTYQKLKQAKNDSWIFRSLSRLNYMFLLVMFLCFFIVFLNKDILYNVYIFPFYLILIGMYLGFISNGLSKKSFEDELGKYGLERLGEQDIFALPLDEYRTKVQAFKAYLRAYSRKHLDSQDTVLFVESRMNPERTLTAMLQTNLMSEDE